MHKERHTTQCDVPLLNIVLGLHTLHINSSTSKAISISLCVYYIKLLRIFITLFGLFGLFVLCMMLLLHTRFCYVVVSFIDDITFAIYNILYPYNSFSLF